MEAPPILASEPELISDSSPIVSEKKLAPEVPPSAVQKEANHQNGTTTEKEICPVAKEEEVAPSPDSLPETKAPEVTAIGPEKNSIESNDSGDLKTVSLNNENDDRVDSIEVGGQGDTASAVAVTASNISSPEAAAPPSATNTTNNGVAPADLKDLEQSPLSKANDPVATTISVDTETIAATGDVTASEASPPPPTAGNDATEGHVDNDDKEKLIVTENGQGDNSQSQGTTPPPPPQAAADDATEEQDTPLAIESVASATLAADEEAEGEKEKKDCEVEDKEPISLDIDPERKDIEEEVVVHEDAITLVIGEPRTVDKEEEEEPSPIKLPSENADTAPEVDEEQDSDEPAMATMQLDDSQEDMDDEERKMPELKLKIKQEPSAAAVCDKPKEENSNEIVTIDIDTDDDESGEDNDEEGSLVGPPVDDDEDDEDEDDVDEDDFEDVEEEVEEFGEEYQEFEVSDEEGADSQDPDLLMVDEGDEVSEDEERFAAMKESNRGAKRKLGDAENKLVQQGSAKERRVGW